VKLMSETELQKTKLKSKLNRVWFNVMYGASLLVMIFVGVTSFEILMDLITIFKFPYDFMVVILFIIFYRLLILGLIYQHKMKKPVIQ